MQVFFVHGLTLSAMGKLHRKDKVVCRVRQKAYSLDIQVCPDNRSPEGSGLCASFLLHSGKKWLKEGDLLDL